MDFCTPQPSRRHNPVDSICRKLQTIQWRGDREPNTPFQIPKLSSSSYDSPRCGLRHNLEAVLKSAAFHRDEGERGKESGMGMPSSGPSMPLSASANTTYTITSTLGEGRGADGGSSRRVRMWQSSTPTTQPTDSPYFAFSGGAHSAQANRTSLPLSRTFTRGNRTFSYNVNFCSADSTVLSECELPYPALVVKRLSMGDGGPSGASENRRNMAEISLICEENLLDTIFHACDTQRRGKVYVSHIVDYLRHTTSRSSEDTGLEELCNMLDPEHKDVSIDLDTYHAVMREWIDDCRSNGQETANNNLQEDSDKFRDSVSARRSMLLNMTSGSLEAFGGEASRAELETSELVHCVADLQMTNQKLQEEVKKLKQVVEGMEESNQKLAEENEQLHNQARVNQQLAQKEKMLKEEVEEMKATLTCTEEGRARASAHSRHMERENQSLIAQIASLQEENFKITMETDELQKKIKELCDINTDLQVQIHSLDAVISEKESLTLEKSRQIDELKAAVEEYSAITELLRKDKNKLESQMQMILPDLAGAGLASYRLNQSSVGSLHTELALAQSPLEVDHLSTTVNVASPLDETLDREVLLMLQGPNPEHMALEFKSLFNKLKKDLTEETNSVLSWVKDLDTKLEDNSDPRLQRVQAELDSRRADWVVSLDQLAQYTDSLEKELIKMTGNLRRSRTEILHLSVRVQEQENQKRQLCDELDQLKASQDSREASSQKPSGEEEPGVEVDWEEEFSLQDFLKHEQVERNCWAHDEQRDCRTDGQSDKLTDKGEDEDAQERWTVVETGEGGVRDASTPLSSVSVEIQLVEGGRDSTACTEPDPVLNSPALQEEAAVPESTHTQAVSIKHPEADALPAPSHSENNTAEALCETAESCSSSSAQTSNSQTKQEPTITPADSAAADMDSPSSTSPRPAETTRGESSPPTGEDHRGEDGDVEADSSSADMSRHKILSREQTMDKPAVEDSTSLLPVLVEEEESVQDGVPGTDQITCSGPNIISEKSAPQSGSSVVRGSQSGGGMSNTTSDPSSPEHSEDKKDFLLGQKRKELIRSMEPVEKYQDENRETSVASRRESETSVISDKDDIFKEDKNSLSPSDKEIEAEFQRLALGFKCDMFTLEKRLRLEERSRDLAEENVRREVSSCQGLLQALTPLCEDDSQSMEIIQRLKKNLDILIQSMTRVSSRSEMLGAIHQENRIGKAVEVMIQHVENLRRTYTKEHAELLELREALMQSERSFGSQTEKDDFRGKKPLQNKSTRRVSIGPIPRSGGGNMQYDLDGSEADAERLTRRSPWNVAGKSMMRPPLKRFVSSVAWVDTEEPSVMMKGPTYTNTEGQSEGVQQEEEEEEEKEELVAERRSSLKELGSKLTSLIMPLKTPSASSTPMSTDPGMPSSVSNSLTGSRSAPAAVARGGRGLWLWLALIVVLAGLLALLAHLVMQQPAADAAPVGTGDSWMTIQQLLWPYAGLRHNGQPPV